jgi:ketosteroid isomerase-like protein
MSQHPSVAVVDQMTQAVFENDRKALEEVFAPDLQFHVRGALPRPGDHEGVDGFLGAMGAIFELTDGDVKIEQLFISAEGAWVAEWENCVLGRNGKTLETRNAFVYRIDDNRISEMWMICAAPNGSESFWV